MKPALLLFHVQAQRRAQLATAQARIDLFAARLADESPGIPEHAEAAVKLTQAEADLRRLQGHPISTPLSSHA